MTELILPPAWVSSGLCGQVDSDLFHPDRGDGAASRLAKRICNGDPRRGTAPCPVLLACREWAMGTEQYWGVWGGMTATERKQLRGEVEAA